MTEAPIELVNWTDEEGSRFGHSLMGIGRLGRRLSAGQGLCADATSTA